MPDRYHRDENIVPVVVRLKRRLENARSAALAKDMLST
jgi:hypothetical protein